MSLVKIPQGMNSEKKVFMKALYWSVLSAIKIICKKKKEPEDRGRLELKHSYNKFGKQ